MLNFRQVYPRPRLRAVLSLFAAAHAPLAAALDLHAHCVRVLSRRPAWTRRHRDCHVINLSTTNSYTGSVALTCVVTSNQGATTLPVCPISPSAATPTPRRRLTVTTVGVAAGTYTVTVTGTARAANSNRHAVSQRGRRTPGSTRMTVSTAISPGTVTAGDGAKATVTVTPIASYIWGGHAVLPLGHSYHHRSSFLRVQCPDRGRKQWHCSHCSSHRFHLRNPAESG